MKREPSNPLPLIEDTHRNLISLEAMQAAAAKLQTTKRSYRVSIVSCDPPSQPRQRETSYSRRAVAVRG